MENLTFMEATWVLAVIETLALSTIAIYVANTSQSEFTNSFGK